MTGLKKWYMEQHSSCISPLLTNPVSKKHTKKQNCIFMHRMHISGNFGGQPQNIHNSARPSGHSLSQDIIYQRRFLSGLSETMSENVHLAHGRLSKILVPLKMNRKNVHVCIFHIKLFLVFDFSLAIFIFLNVLISSCFLLFPHN